jgi:hypothetical protein
MYQLHPIDKVDVRSTAIHFNAQRPYPETGPAAARCGTARNNYRFTVTSFDLETDGIKRII